MKIKNLNLTVYLLKISLFFKSAFTTALIFYLNTNNGYTKFEDGTVVKSIANRLLTFPTLCKHTSSSCTDVEARVNINFNYF